MSKTERDFIQNFYNTKVTAKQKEELTKIFTEYKSYSEFMNAYIEFLKNKTNKRRRRRTRRGFNIVDRFVDNTIEDGFVLLYDNFFEKIYSYMRLFKKLFGIYALGSKFGADEAEFFKMSKQLLIQVKETSDDKTDDSVSDATHVNTHNGGRHMSRRNRRSKKLNKSNRRR